MKIIVGLGNPGKQYENTRHNVGFRAVDKLSDKLNIKIDKIKFKAVYGETNYKGEKIILIKPQTYMNNSGESVRDFVNFYKISPEDLVVIYDDIDIDFGEIRIRKKGSSGSHNGMKSVIYLINSDEFPRIRIGIGKKFPEQDLADFVLSRFSKDEADTIESAIDNAADAALNIIDSGVDDTMNKFNHKSKNNSEVI